MGCSDIVYKFIIYSHKWSPIIIMCVISRFRNVSMGNTSTLAGNGDPRGRCPQKRKEARARYREIIPSLQKMLVGLQNVSYEMSYGSVQILFTCFIIDI